MSAVPGQRHEVSSGQQRLWQLDQVDPGSPTWNVAAELGLRGRLDVHALQRGLDALVARHASLRTCFATENGRLVAVVSEGVGLDLAWDRSLEQATCVRFDLGRAPLLRASLVRVADQDHVLVLTSHQSVSDGRSLELLAFELGECYSRIVGAEPRPPPAHRYACFAAWQNAWLTSEDALSRIACHRSRLEHLCPVMDVPTDWRRPRRQAYEAGLEQLAVQPGLLSALRGLAPDRGAGLPAVLVAALQALMLRQTGDAGVCIGMTVLGRPLSGLDDVVGPFVDHLLLPTAGGAGRAFRRMVDDAASVIAEAEVGGVVPLSRLAGQVAPGDCGGSPPLPQVCLDVVDAPRLPPRFRGLDVYRTPARPLSVPFDLLFRVLAEADGTTSLQLAYAHSLFSPSRMAELLRQFEQLLWELSRSPDRAPTGHSLVTPAARRVLPDPTAPLDRTWRGAVPELFARQCREMGERTAIEATGERVSYRRLDDLSRHLACHLLACDVGPRRVVAIVGDRRPELVWAVLGVMRAGATFLILDPRDAADRIEQQMRLVRPAALIRLVRAPDLRLNDMGCPVRVALPPCHHQGALGWRTHDGPQPEPGAGDVACIAFTSGSAGLSKGVLGLHGSLTHFQPWLARTFELGRGDRYGMLSGLSHDPLHRDLFTPLTLGGVICCPDPEEHASGLAAAAMARLGVTVAHLTPATLQLLVHGAEVAGCRLQTLRLAFVVGDRLTVRDAERLRDVAPGVTVVNYYGATETQRAVGYHVVDTERGAGRETVPLGRGIPGVQLLVLNDAGQLAGVGELGRIHFRSPHLAAGYLANDVLTAERFIRNPFGSVVTGDRIYRTGDLGRYLPNGEVEFAGRHAELAQIGGMRVDTAEIAAVLGRHPRVGTAVAIQRGSDGRIVAYYRPRQRRPSAADLRVHVRERLPEHLVPAAFVELDAIPLTPNGKLDRARLPAAHPDAAA